MKFVTNSASETKKLGKLLGKEIRRGLTIALTGDLGSGKTTFTQGLADGLGLKERIISPTFVIMRKYKIAEEKKLGSFCHIDFYRIRSSKDLRNLDFEKTIKNPKNIVVIEWAERAKDFLPPSALQIEFEHLSDTKRKINFYRINNNNNN